MENPNEVIERIRKIHFQIGLDKSKASDDIVACLTANKKMLEGFSRVLEEINTRKNHFIYELIQNAEDNQYCDGVKPRIGFTLNNSRLLVKNNENGFSADDVEALCGAGASQKLKTKARAKARVYIGEKGIGFKSVFRVTNNPQIFSNGFNFEYRYDKNDPISILVPYVISDTPEFVNLDETNIVIPMDSDTLRGVQKSLHGINPSVLLFLSKLKEITIEDEGRVEQIRKDVQEKTGTVTISFKENETRWRVVKRIIDMSEIYEDKREEFDETEILAAFPLDKDDNAAISEQEVFAFLPIRKYGFKFTIQADFILSANREDIIRDKPWNMHIRDSIPNVFLAAVDLFKKDKNLRHAFYGYIPLPKDVEDDFFKPVVERIYESLKQHKCFLTESGSWEYPNKCVMADKSIRSLVSNSGIQKLKEKEYISDKIEIRKQVFQKLEVEELSLEGFVDLLSDENWVKNTPIYPTKSYLRR
jgi:hypothetical protein